LFIELITYSIDAFGHIEIFLLVIVLLSGHMIFHHIFQYCFFDYWLEFALVIVDLLYEFEKSQRFLVDLGFGFALVPLLILKVSIFNFALKQIDNPLSKGVDITRVEPYRFLTLATYFI